LKRPAVDAGGSEPAVRAILHPMLTRTRLCAIALLGCVVLPGCAATTARTASGPSLSDLEQKAVASRGVVEIVSA